MEEMGMTADVEIEDESDDRHFKDVMRYSSLNIRCHEVEHSNADHKALVIDCMFHTCNDYCLGPKDQDGKNAGHVNLSLARNPLQTIMTLPEKT